MKEDVFPSCHERATKKNFRIPTRNNVVGTLNERQPEADVEHQL